VREEGVNSVRLSERTGIVIMRRVRVGGTPLLSGFRSFGKVVLLEEPISS